MRGGQDSTLKLSRSLQADHEDWGAVKEAMQEDDLPDGWTKHEDQGSGKTFYSKGGKTQWEKPAAPEFSGSVKRTESFLESANPMTMNNAANAAPLDLKCIDEDVETVQIGSSYESYKKRKTGYNMCWRAVELLALLLLLLTACKVFYPKLLPEQIREIGPTASDSSTADTSSSSAAAASYERAIQGSSLEKELHSLGTNDKVAVLASLMQQQMALIALQNETIRGLTAELQGQKQAVEEVEAVPGPAGPTGPEGKCVGVLGGNEVWVGGKPQTKSECGGGWTRCSFRKSPESDKIYTEPSGGLISAKVGDRLVFGHLAKTNSYNVYRLPDLTAYQSCNFSNSTMLADGSNQIRMEAGRAPFELPLGPLDQGDLFFATYDSKLWNCASRAMRVRVRVSPQQEVVVASSSSGDLAKSSRTVQQLEGVVSALSRLNALQQVQTEQRIRSEGGSGLTRIRGYETGLAAYNDASYSRYAIMNIHNHANIRNTVGMGELQAVLNGVEFQTRHNDYKMSQHLDDLADNPSIDGYKQLREIPRPAVPPEVLSKPTVDAQVWEMQQWFKAWKDQDWSVRDYRKYFKPNLCVLEGTWITENEDLADPFASDRHQIDAKTWNELHDKIRYLFNSGRKHNLENLAYLPQAIRRMVQNHSLPEFANWEYRIFCEPVSEDVPLQRFRVAQDLAPQLFKRPTTKAELYWERRARFELNPQVNANGAPGYPASPGGKIGWAENPTAWNYMDWLMEQVPGKDGYRANLTDYWDDSIATHYLRASEPLNVGYYSRYYNVEVADAMGLNRRRRGFNDGFLWAAKTKQHLQVSRLQAWDEKGQVERESAWSYAIPLEVIFTTPLESWNPYELPQGTDEYSCKANTSCCSGHCCFFGCKPNLRFDGSANAPTKYTVEQLIQGKHEVDAGAISKLRTGKPTKDPLTGAHACDATTAYNAFSPSDYFYTTPAGFYGDDGSGSADAADTSSGATCVLDQNGVARYKPVMAAGTWIILPSIGDGVGKVRTRFPIVPLHVHGASAWKELKALEDLVLPANYEASTGDSQMFGDARDSVYGFDMTLDGGGHSHNLKVGANTVRSWDEKFDAGDPDYEVLLTSEIRNAHEHIVRVRRNRTSVSEPWRYFLLECQFKGAAEWDEGGVCADGHTLVSRINYVAS